MARPTKQGVDYFPLDLHLDDKFKFIEIKYGLEGFAIVIKLYQKIYSCGFWCGWSEDETLLFGDEIRADINVVNNVVNECINRGIFDTTLYKKHRILTSRGIQKRYFDIVKRRKDIEVITEYLIIKPVNADINLINVDNNPENAYKSTQSKVKESKVKESKVKNKEPCAHDAIAKTQYADFVSMTNDEYTLLVAKLGEDGTKRCIEILDNYKGANGKKYKSDYRAILNWVVSRYEEERAKGKDKPARSPTKQVDGVKYDMHDYSDVDKDGLYNNF